MGRTAIDEELYAEISAMAEEAGCELLHVEFHQGNFRVFLDHPEGVTLEHCEAVSRQLSALLDVSDFGRGRYTLEVSSPGLDRRLFGPGDYERFRGRTVRVTFRTGTERRKRTVIGTLEGLRSDGAGRREIGVADQESGEDLQIPFDDVEVARLVVEL